VIFIVEDKEKGCEKKFVKKIFFVLFFISDSKDYLRHELDETEKYYFREHKTA
jgi:hypothetical protein